MYLLLGLRAVRPRGWNKHETIQEDDFPPRSGEKDRAARTNALLISVSRGGRNGQGRRCLTAATTLSHACTAFIEYKEPVMATLTIRKLDDDIKTGLRLRAAAHGQSMEEEVL